MPDPTDVTDLLAIMAEDVDPEMLCSVHAEHSIIQTYSLLDDTGSNTPRIYRIIGCEGCGHAVGYITGIAEPERFATYQQ